MAEPNEDFLRAQEGLPDGTWSVRHDTIFERISE